MSFMSTTLKHHITTDIELPQPNGGKSAGEIVQLGLKCGLEIVQNLDAWIRLNPLVVKVEPMEQSSKSASDIAKLASGFDVPFEASYATSDFKRFEVVDRLDLAFGFTKDLTYYVALRSTEDGIEGLSDAGSGVTVWGKYQVVHSKEKPGIITLIEDTATKCHRIFSLFISGTLEPRHKDMHEAFRTQWQEKMKAAMNE